MQLQRNKPKKTCVLAVSLVMVSLLLSGCIGQEEEREEVIFKEPVNEDPSTLDPDDGYSSTLANYYRMFYNKLVRHERKNMAIEIEPELATSWDMSPDGMVWTFELRQGVKFHDGTPFNATAVKYHVERTQGMYLSPAWMYDIVDSVEVVDTYTARINLNVPYLPFLEEMAGAWGNWIVSPSAGQKHATADDPWAHEWFLENEAGTGPFMLDHWTRGQELVAVRFPDYWEGWEGKHIDKIMFLIGIVEASTRRLMLEAGDLDLVGEWGFSPSDKLALSDVEGVELYKFPSLNNLMIFFNYQKSPTNDVKVRQAISYGFDYQAIVDNIMLGAASQGQGPLPKSLKGHNPALFQYSKDHAKAAQLLDDAGYTLGTAGPDLRLELTILYWAGEESQRKISEFMQSELAKIGVKITIESNLYGAIMDMIHGDPQEAADMIFLYWYPDYADPDSYLWGLFWSEAWWNMGMYNDPRVDDLLDKAQFEVDPVKRAEIHNEIQRITVDEAWAIYLYDLENWICMRSWVKNFYYNPIYHDMRDYWYLYVEKEEE